MQPLPDARFLPATQPSSVGRAAAAAQFFREQTPGTPRAQDKDDASKGDARGNPRATTCGLWWLLRQQGFNGVPQVVGDKG